MSKAIEVKAQGRKELGSAAVRRVRRQGMVPGIVYGAEKENRLVSLNHHEFEQLLAHHAGSNLMLDLSIDGAAPVKALLKEVQRHAITGHILHLDFFAVSMTKRLAISVPVELVGEPTGVTQQGGILEHLLRTIEVECLPGDVLEFVEVDVSNLNVGDRLTVADIVLDKGKYEVTTAPNIGVAMVLAPRVEEAASAEGAAEGAAPAEPEVIREKKPKEGEEEESK